MTVGQFCEIIYGLLKVHNGSVTSWVRSEAHNSFVGGLPNSRHPLGLAVDVVLDDMATFMVGDFIMDCFRAGLEAVEEGKGTNKHHIHVEYDGVRR